ncbi:MAG TPA: DUF1501 domain-containing protein [Acidimicrobiales bacterium]|nr:DUF1501 domain-containing protein [Acidimicrobiales bacterium]
MTRDTRETEDTRQPPLRVLHALADRVTSDRERRRGAWSRGFTRRQVLAGAGMAGVAALGTQLVTTRASFGAPGGGTLVVLFLRGGMDGLSVVVPAGDPHLAQVRPDIAVPAGELLPLDRGFGLHPALGPLHELWKKGQFTAVPATSTPDLSRSHFQAQDCLERGGSSTGTLEGWLDRVLDGMGPGTTFRALGSGPTLPRSLAGDQAPLALRRIDDLRLRDPDSVRGRTRDALKALYTGVDGPVTGEVASGLASMDIAAVLGAVPYQPAGAYPDGDLGVGLSQIARLVKSDLGVRVACIDLGGWDMHTHIGTIDGGFMKDNLTALGQNLGAFAADLGDRLGDVTLVGMTEFGRRVAQNGNAGADHGHGSTVLLMGGGLAGGTVHGAWPGLAPGQLVQGDVPGANDFRDVLGELVVRRLGLGTATLGSVFPGHAYHPLGVTR